MNFREELFSRNKPKINENFTRRSHTLLYKRINIDKDWVILLRENFARFYFRKLTVSINFANLGKIREILENFSSRKFVPLRKYKYAQFN